MSDLTDPIPVAPDAVVIDFPDRESWLAAHPNGHVQTSGLCDRDTIHGRHVFTSDVFSTHISGWDCPGQWAQCRNCDDVQCMDCRTRTWHDNCVRDCPHCCAPAATPAS